MFQGARRQGIKSGYAAVKNGRGPLGVVQRMAVDIASAAPVEVEEQRSREQRGPTCSVAPRATSAF